MEPLASGKYRMGNRLQDAADARRRVRRRPIVLQVPGNKANAVPCERLRVLLSVAERVAKLK